MKFIPNQIYNYHSGANTRIKLFHTNQSDRKVLLGEVAALTWKLTQNRLPLYGYNAPEFSAVAHGQIIVIGNLILNYVSHEYLLAAIRSSNLTASEESSYNNLSSEELAYMYQTSNDSEAVRALKERYFRSSSTIQQSQFNSDLRYNFGRPDQHTKSLDIELSFGDTNSSNSTLHVIKHVYFNSRALSVMASEDNIKESLEFIARSVI